MHVPCPSTFPILTSNDPVPFSRANPYPLSSFKRGFARFLINLSAIYRPQVPVDMSPYEI